MMSITLIEKYPMDLEQCKITVKRILTDVEKNLFAQFFVLEELIFGDKLKSLHALCRMIHERDLWIQCDCRDSGFQPVFRIKQASSGTFYLHRITSRAEHAASCLFKEVVYNHNKNPLKESKPFLKKNVPFNLMGKKSDSLWNTSESKSAHSQSQGTKRTKLARVLFHLLDASGLNTVGFNDQLKPSDALLQAAQSLELTQGIFVANYLELNPNRIRYRAVSLKDDSSWKNNREKHLLALVHVSSFDEHTLDVIYPDKSIKKIPIAHRIYRSSGRFSARTSPYIALILIGTTAESPGFYQPIKAFVMPSYSTASYFPVDSFYEREVLRHLYRLYFELLKQGHSFQIVKPLFDIEVSLKGTQEQCFVLPDFLIRQGRRTLVLEVNGSHELDYLERKKRTHEHMKHLGTLLSFDAYLAETENRWNQEITLLMQQITDWLVCR